MVADNRRCLIVWCHGECYVIKNLFKQQNWTLAAFQVELKKLLIRFNVMQFGPSVHSFVFAVFVRSSSTGLNGYFEISLNLMAGSLGSA